LTCSQPLRDLVLVEEPPTLNLVRGQFAVGRKPIDLLRLAAQDLCELVGGKEGRQGHSTGRCKIAEMRHVLNMVLKDKALSGR
jgi:hypothetical protein